MGYTGGLSPVGAKRRFDVEPGETKRMKIDVKSRHYELLIVILFFSSFLCFLFGQWIVGILLAGLGLFSIWKQEKVLKARKRIYSKVSYAGFWVRFGSLTVDVGINFLGLMILFSIFGTVIFNYFQSALLDLLSVFVPIYMLKRWGQSPGKMVMGIKVVKTDFSKLTWLEIFLRQILDVFWCFWDSLKGTSKNSSLGLARTFRSA